MKKHKETFRALSANKKAGIRLVLSVILYVAVFLITYFVAMPEYAKIILFAAVYLIAGQDVLYKAFKNIIRGKLFDENFLMTVATIGAFFIGEYYDAVAVMLFYQTGELFQKYAVGKSRKSISEMMDIRPESARVIRDGSEIQVHPSVVEVGEIVTVRAGEKVALDGIVTEGESALNTAALTGESAPRTVSSGDKILSGSINLNGLLKFKTTATFDDSTVSKILDLVENASSQKAPAENFITKFSRVYTPVVVILAVLIGVVPPLFLGGWNEWLKRALMFLFVSCPCALVISVPLSFFGGIGSASKRGILVKGGNYLELLSKADVFVFDKTGTLTEGKFAVDEVFPENKRDEILALAAVAESKSNHPVAIAVTAAAKNVESNDYTVTEYAGKGVKAVKGQQVILCGNAALLKENGVEAEETDAEGTVVYVAENGKFIGYVTVRDKIKAETKQALQLLQKRGAKTVMLTGDNAAVAAKVAQETGVTDFEAELLPSEKVERVEKIIKEKQKGSVVAFCGDGINDAPVLMRANLGIAMGNVGSDAAIEAADVVLMYDKLTDISLAKRIADKTIRIVRENIAFAIGVKLAVLALSAFGILGNMIYAVLADVGVSVLAVLNAMRCLKIPEKRT